MPLLRGAARVAVVAGTATAVSNRVSRRQANRWADQDTQYQPIGVNEERALAPRHLFFPRRSRVRRPTQWS